MLKYAHPAQPLTRAGEELDDLYVDIYHDLYDLQIICLYIYIYHDLYDLQIICPTCEQLSPLLLLGQRTCCRQSTWRTVEKKAVLELVCRCQRGVSKFQRHVGHVFTLDRRFLPLCVQSTPPLTAHKGDHGIT